MNPVLRAAGKTGEKVVAVFAASAEEAAVAVEHVRRGGVALPIYLYCCARPSLAIARACASVRVHESPVTLFLLAQRDLWPHWVALGVAPWTGRRGAWPLKLAPFFFPPFRVLVLNENDDFFSAKPEPVFTHLSRRARRLARADFTRVKHVLRGVLAYPFAFLAQQHSPLSRFVFRRMRGTETLSLAPSRSREEGVVLFEYQGREWRWEELAEALARTESRWILFQQAGTQEPVDDMLPLFSDKRTFAVARQNAFRGWSKLLFPTAPFQTLQAGEASRVFAPLSHQILVDRAKLLALGLPKLSGYGSSWYLLFWKAAAAGWSSYSAGATANLHELVGYPFYEAQFVHALLVDPALARLKPREPLLARGNITRTKTGGMGFRGLPRVLILSPYLPYPLSHGGAVRIFSLCQALAGRIDFVLVCFREKTDHVDYDKLHEVFREVYVMAIDEKHANPHLPAQVSGYESTSMRALIPDICFQLRIEILQLEYTQMAAYRETVPHLPAILVEHDITFTLHRQLADRDGSPHAWREYQNWLKFECDRLGAFEEVWTMSEHDRQQAIRAGSASTRTIAVPNGVDLERFWAGPETGEAIEILYVGSFRHRPNYLGFEELRKQIMPAVWAEFPELRLRVVAGPNHEKHWEGSREMDPRIVVHGFVEDVAPLYRQCALVVVPLPVSAGTNIKVMEALASERAVVTTPLGCVGLDLRDGHDAVVRELGSGFAAAICDLLRDAEMRRAIARRARETAGARFGWKAIAGTAFAAYERLLPKATAVGGREPDRRG